MNFADRTFELKEIETLRGHTGQVCCVAWNPASGVDGVPAMIASGGADRGVIIWVQNTATGSFQRKEVLRKLHYWAVTCCAFVASHSLLLTSAVRGRPFIWKSYEGSFNVTNFFKDQEYDNLLVNVSVYASGELIATSSPQTDIRIWKISLEIRSFESVSSVQDSKECARMIQWHPLKDILFSCGIDNAIKIWVPDADMVNWDCIQTLVENNSDNTITIWSLDVDMMRYGERNDPGEEIFCTGAADGAICVFIKNGDESSDESVYKLLLKKDHAHGRDINSVQWCPQDNSRLASASDDGTIKIWELASIPRV
ncbi:protein CIA1-like [Henckelia pumila]|uniref:protein CIA1-like n=1 Tax=Henckelia pumila TaxID=405737 RepID=UPI003C6E9406